MDEKSGVESSLDQDSIQKKPKRGYDLAADVAPEASLSAVVEGIGAVAHGIVSTGKNVGLQIGRLIPGTANEPTGSTGGGFSDDGESSSSLLGSLGSSVSRTAGSVAEGTGSLLSSTSSGLGRALSTSVDGLGHLTSGAGSVASGAGDVISAAGHAAGAVLSGLADAAGPVAEAAGDAAGEILGGIGDVLN